MECHFLSFLVLGLVAGGVHSAPEVLAYTGRIVGVDSVAFETEKEFYAYYGIPFAQPPVGDLRFRPPVPLEDCGSDDRINSDFYKPMCSQPQGLIPHEISEDCLYLNIFTPPTVDCADFDTNARTKVIFYIHGGGFSSGEAFSYPASNWVTDYNVILVVTAYRLGPLGFLSSGDEALPGNNGLLDQILALKWVNENIHLFGGDANDITIAGTSAGAASVSLLSISPLAKGLFNKAMMDAGNALCPWVIDVTYEDTFYKMAEKANCFPDNIDYRQDRIAYHTAIVDCLREIEANKFVNLLAEVTRTSEEDVLSMEGYISFAPVIDGFVIPRDPFDLMADETYLEEVGALNRTYMVGCANNEAMLFLYQSLAFNVIPQDAITNPDNPVAKKIIYNNLCSVFPCPIMQAIYHAASLLYYYPLGADGRSTKQSTMDFMSDVDFVIPVVKFARALHKADNSTKVFMFLFDHYPPPAVSWFEFKGSTHGLAMTYMFDATSPMIPLVFYANITSDENDPLSDNIRGMISNLAKVGDPSLANAKWTPYDLENESFMRISPQPKEDHHLYHKRVSMWTDFLPNVFKAVYSRTAARAPFLW